jgi:peptidoglycan glycosyltransferase
MSDLLERLAAANPVPDSEEPSIDDVWRKIAERGATPRRARHRWLPPRVGRTVLTVAAAVVPIILVVAVVIPGHGARHGTARRTSPGAIHGKTALDPGAQRVAARQLAGRVGSIVALDPRTGAIKVMCTNVTRGGCDATSAAPEAQTQALYPTGATFEVVTAAAALDSGRYTPTSRIAGPSPLTVAGSPLRNQFNQSYGPLTLAQALGYSADTVFAQVGQTVGRPTMTRYMRRFGFYSAPRLSSAAQRLAASGVRLRGKLVLPTNDRVDLGRLGTGQGQLAATPMQMAMVAAAVADGGRLMAPHLRATAPALSGQVIKPSTARVLTAMMRDIVEHGTATPADLAGLQIAGKTGTAHVGARGSGRTQLWFIGFAPADDPKIAIAVTVSDVNGGYGGTEAAPIAARVIEQLLGKR